MGKIIVSEFVSLDGVMEDPGWSAPYINEEQLEFKFAELMESDALLLGRATYEGFAEAWPNITDEAAGFPAGFAGKMNGMPKFVATNTLQAPLEWNASRIEGDVVEAVRALKQVQTLLVAGSAALANTLMQHGLVDEVRLLVYPVVLGRGKRLFETGTTLKLKRVDAKQFRTGIAVLTYHPE